MVYVITTKGNSKILLIKGQDFIGEDLNDPVLIKNIDANNPTIDPFKKSYNILD